MKYENIIYSHEHMSIDLSGIKKDDDCRLNVYQEALDEIKDLYNKGVRTIIECTNYGMGKDKEIIKKISDETGIKFIDSTGYYKDPFMPSICDTYSVEDFKKSLIPDLDAGVKIIGEIGTSLNVITDNERKLFEACSELQTEYDCVLITHTTLGTMALEQIEILKKHNVNFKKVIISHVALKNDLEYIVDILKNGCNVAFDTIGKLSYLSDDTRADFLVELCNRGYENNIVMSMDITRKSHLKKNGGVGYAYLLDTFVPLLEKKGLSSEVINKLLSKNFSRILKEQKHGV